MYSIGKLNQCFWSGSTAVLVVKGSNGHPAQRRYLSSLALKIVIWFTFPIMLWFRRQSTWPFLVVSSSEQTHHLKDSEGKRKKIKIKTFLCSQAVAEEIAL